MKNPPNKIWLAFGTCKYGQICFPYVKKRTARNLKTIMEKYVKTDSDAKVKIVEYQKVDR